LLVHASVAGKTYCFGNETNRPRAIALREKASGPLAAVFDIAGADDRQASPGHHIMAPLKESMQKQGRRRCAMPFAAGWASNQMSPASPPAAIDKKKPREEGRGF
jgi:hypothetical protein